MRPMCIFPRLLAGLLLLCLVACGGEPLVTPPETEWSTESDPLIQPETEAESESEKETATETEPVETDPAETEPAETEPAETEPAETEPAETEPEENEVVETEPHEHLYAVISRDDGTWYISSCHVCDSTGEIALTPGALSSTGEETDSPTTLRTDFLWADDLRLMIPEGLSVHLYSYTDTAFVSSRRLPVADPLRLENYLASKVTRVRLVFSSTTPATPSTDPTVEAPLTTPMEMTGITFASNGGLYEVTADTPWCEGAKNVLLRFEQMVKLTYTPLAPIAQNISPIGPGATVTGIPYSSSRPEALYVPNNVSFYTFLTALQNPNSYIYTVDLGAEPYYNQNGRTYYGAVCSTAAAYALDILTNYSTHQWADIPGMTPLADTDPENLRLCDTIVGKGHVVMVTGIRRAPNGSVVALSVSEAAGRNVHAYVYTPESFSALYPAADYTYCRYDKVESVPYTPSPFVAVGDEVAVPVDLTLPLIPRKGDCSNWLLGSVVEIDVMDGTGYDTVVVYRDGTEHMTLPLTELISLELEKPGYYTAALRGEAGESEPCSFAIIDAQSAATVDADGTVTVHFSSSMGEPLWVQWASEANGTVHVTELTAEEAAAGVALCRYQSGTYKIRVAFRTEYGIIHSILPGAMLVP